MDVFEFAMEKERLSEDYYRQLGGKTGNKGLANILTMLADEERKHFEVVRQMQQQAPAMVTDVDILKDAGAAFEEMREAAEQFSFDITELQLYEKARDIEKDSRQFYLEKAEEVSDSAQREIFKKLANEEEKHLALVQGICDFVARPLWFLENAEMYHFDDYVEGPL
jgi:rubrerythrin